MICLPVIPGSAPKRRSQTTVAQKQNVVMPLLAFLFGKHTAALGVYSEYREKTGETCAPTTRFAVPLVVTLKFTFVKAATAERLLFSSVMSRNSGRGNPVLIVRQADIREARPELSPDDPAASKAAGGAGRN